MVTNPNGERLTITFGAVHFDHRIDLGEEPRASQGRGGGGAGWVEVDYDVLRGIDSPVLRLF